MRRQSGHPLLAPALLVVLGFAAFTANPGGITLPSIDDCFYARKGVEMARRGAFFTVTWNGAPSFTYPPLQFWILGRAFAWLGENDAAARLPSAVMATGMVAATGWIAMRLAGVAAGGTAMALLLVSPYLLNNARRCMTEVPLAFWTTLALVILIAGRERRRIHALLALPLAAGILTKSLLGLLPLLALAGAAVADRSWRAALRNPWLWLGVVLGLVAGASWSLHQWSQFGPGALREHYLAGVLSISTRPIGWLARLTGYPTILLRDFQPVVLPALAGLWMLWRTRRAAAAERPPAAPSGARRADHLLVAAWWIVPLLLYGASSTQSARYLFPAFPAMAVLGGVWLAARAPRVASVVRDVVVPVGLAVATLVLWLAPALLTRDVNRAFRDQREVLQARIPDGEPLAFLGHDYWRYANPLLYYNERLLEMPPDDMAASAVVRARGHASGLLLVERARLDEVRALVPEVAVVLEAQGGVIVDVGAAPGSTPAIGFTPAAPPASAPTP